MKSAEVAAVLLAYGRELDEQHAAQVGDSFSGCPEADALIEHDANAFLLGVLFTQGIPAERAWKGPYLLQQRLGSIEPAYLAGHPEKVRAAIQQPPMLHRFKETLPRWVVAAGARLSAEYNADASTVWGPDADVSTVIGRLGAFDGIGRKKAVMAASILVRHFRIPLAGVESSQVAFDVHVRRVFLRSGLADEDTVCAIEAAATRWSPSEPALLDLPAWLIGRDWCRPLAPRCEACRLGAVCARRTAIIPAGVGE